MPSYPEFIAILKSGYSVSHLTFNKLLKLNGQLQSVGILWPNTEMGVFATIEPPYKGFRVHDSEWVDCLHVEEPELYVRRRRKLIYSSHRAKEEVKYLISIENAVKGVHCFLNSNGMGVEWSRVR